MPELVCEGCAVGAVAILATAAVGRIGVSLRFGLHELSRRSSGSAISA
jgi:hypothetical protein